jgi:hypothetical protein
VTTSTFLTSTRLRAGAILNVSPLIREASAFLYLGDQLGKFPS